MTRFLVAAFLVAAAPVAGRALDPSLELSVGSGGTWVNDDAERVPTSIMLTGGVGVVPMLKLQLGVLTRPDDSHGRDADIDLRPMVMFNPPLLPFHVRAILSIPTVIDGTTQLDAGGALGVRLGLLGVSVFAEAGYLTRISELDSTPTFPGHDWIVEGRVGIGLD